MSNKDPALTDGATASLPPAGPTLPAPEMPLEYMLIRAARVNRYANEEVGATHELVAGFFTTDSSANEASRNVLASDGPIVVRVPLGYKLMRIHEEVRAAKHLRAIRMLLTGKSLDQPFQIEEEMEAVVETCRRVFHAYRMLREKSLKVAITEALNKAGAKELFGFAQALRALPEEFKDDPFEDHTSLDPEAVHRAIDRGVASAQQPHEAGTRVGEGLRPRRA